MLVYLYDIIRNKIFQILKEIKKYRCCDIDLTYHIAFFEERYFGIIGTGSYTVWYIDVLNNSGLPVIDKILTSRRYIYKMRFTGDFVYEENPNYYLVTANIPKRDKNKVISLIKEGYLVISSQLNQNEYDRIANEIINESLIPQNYS